MLAQLEGCERGPAGNTSLAAAFALAQQLLEDNVVVVQETEYTGAGKHPTAQLTFAREQGITIRRGDPRTSRPGESIVIPLLPEQIGVQDLDLETLRRSYLRNSFRQTQASTMGQSDLQFLMADARASRELVLAVADESKVRFVEGEYSAGQNARGRGGSDAKKR
jgi:hypothetical protein